MTSLEQLKHELITILKESVSIPEEEKGFLMGNIDLFNEEELEQLIENNQ